MRIMAFCGGRTFSGAKRSMASLMASGERDGRGFDLALIDVFARVEPLAVVVALEAAEELESFRRCSGERRCHVDYRKRDC